MDEIQIYKTRIYLALEDDDLVRQCKVDRFRSSGPGGQKRNKTSSGIRLRHTPTGLSIKATEDRSQHVNLRRAVRRLREAIALRVRTEFDLADYQMSECLQSCIQRDGKIVVGHRDFRYAPVVAELLDVFHAYGMGVRDTAHALDISTSQLSHFFHRNTKLFRQVNLMRKEAGLKTLQ